MENKQLKPNDPSEDLLFVIVEEMYPYFEGMDIHFAKPINEFINACNKGNVADGIAKTIRNVYHLWDLNSQFYLYFKKTHHLTNSEDMVNLIIRKVYEKYYTIHKNVIRKIQDSVLVLKPEVVEFLDIMEKFTIENGTVYYRVPFVFTHLPEMPDFHFTITRPWPESSPTIHNLVYGDAWKYEGFIENKQVHFFSKRTYVLYVSSDYKQCRFGTRKGLYYSGPLVSVDQIKQLQTWIHE